MHAAHQSPHLLIIGLRASGKSTVAAHTARLLGCTHSDLDDRTAALLGCRAAGEAFRTHGEAAFRKAEREALATALSDTARVIALGGGTPTAPGARDLIDAARRAGDALVVFIDPPVDAMAARLARDEGDRPSLTGRGVVAEIEEVAAARRPLYAEIADVVIAGEASTRDAAQIAAEIAAFVDRRGHRI
ncbi:MAG: shikimate kinase [Phycisphaerales bacterium]